MGFRENVAIKSLHIWNLVDLVSLIDFMKIYLWIYNDLAKYQIIRTNLFIMSAASNRCNLIVQTITHYADRINDVHLIKLSYIDFIAAFMPYILLLKEDMQYNLLAQIFINLPGLIFSTGQHYLTVQTETGKDNNLPISQECIGVSSHFNRCIFILPCREGRAGNYIDQYISKV